MSYKPSQDEQQQDGPVRYLPCRYCGKQTLVETLSHYGARCLACFEAYCAAGSRNAPVTDDYADKGRRAWAHRLRDRHQRGERLTRAQVDAYEAAVR